MYLVREIMNTKPGKAKELVKKFKQMAPYMEKEGGMKNIKVMTDAVGPYWTVVTEFEVEDMGSFFKELRGGGTPPPPELEKIMEGYTELVNGGSREIYVIE